MVETSDNKKCQTACSVRIVRELEPLSSLQAVDVERCVDEPYGLDGESRLTIQQRFRWIRASFALFIGRAKNIKKTNLHHGN